MFPHCFNFNFVCYHIKCFNIMCFVSSGPHIFGDKTLQLLLNLSKIIISGWVIFKIKRIQINKSLIIDGSSFNDTHFLAIEILKLNNAINTKQYFILFFVMKHL